MMARERMTWPNWFDGAPDGTDRQRYHIRGYPRVFVLDAKGVIRSRRSGPPVLTTPWTSCWQK